MEIWVGLDYGLKRIGIAISDEGKRMAFPLCVIAHTSWGDDIRRLRNALARYDVEKIILGDPVNDDGTSGEQSRETRGFGERLEREGFKVEYVNEAHSSAEALELLHESGHNSHRAKDKVDMAAATLILTRYIAENNIM